MERPEIDKAATAIMGNLGPTDRTEFGPILLAIIVNVVAALITRYGPELLKKLGSMNLCQKIRLKKSIRAACTREEYKRHGQAIYDATVTTFPQFTADQVAAMMREVRAPG